MYLKRKATGPHTAPISYQMVVAKGKNKNEMGKQFNDNCNHCGKQGHLKADCWELTENAVKDYPDIKAIVSKQMSMWTPAEVVVSNL